MLVIKYIYLLLNSVIKGFGPVVLNICVKLAELHLLLICGHEEVIKSLLLILIFDVLIDDIN